MLIDALASVVLGAVFLLFAGYNGLIFAARLQDAPARSVAPVVGGLAGALALWLWPYHDVRPWAWLPLLLDYGCVPYLAIGAFLGARRKWRYREANLLGTLEGESDEKSVRIRLYRGGRMLLEESFKRPGRFGSFSVAGTWRDANPAGGYLLDVWGAAITVGKRDGTWMVASESDWFAEELRIAPMTLAWSAAPRASADG